MPTHRVPFTSPPCDVGGVGLEFSGQAKGNDQLEDKALESNGRNHSKKCLCKNPTLEEEHDLPEGKQHDDRDSMSNSSENGSELFAAHTQDRAHTTSHGEEDRESTGIDGDRGKCNDCHTDQRICWLLEIRALNTCLSVDK